MTDKLPNETIIKENYSWLLFKEYNDINQASCLDMLHSSERGSFIKTTHGPELVRNVCNESYALNAGIDKQVDQLEELLPYKPLYEKESTNSLLSGDVSCVKDLSSSSVPGPEGSSDQWNCAHCDYTHGSVLEARRLCPYTPLSDAEGTGIAEMRGADQEEYGRMESYSSGTHQQSLHVNPAIKTEPNEWVDVSDTTLRRVCQVCGDHASGCHYGAVTCGSCKVFFKRAAEGKQNYLCASRNDCTIDKLRRKNCASCRLRRCFLCGMSLKGRKLKGSGQPSGGLEGGTHVRDRSGDGAQRNGETAAGHASLSGPSSGLHSGLSLLSVLQVIEPGVVNAGHDPAQPDCPASLLTSLNELGERQLVSVVRWAKGIPGFRDLHVEDQLSVIQSSWLSIMVIGLGWRSYTHTHASMLYFAPDLVFNDQRMRVSSMYDHCARMRLLSERFCALRVTQEEFLCMKALLLFSIIPVEGLRSQHCFDELRAAFIRELDRLAGLHGETTRTQRLFQLTKLLDFLQPIVRKLHQFTYDLFIQAQTLPTRVVYPDMISEIVGMHVPKILTGLVKPILFHAAL